MYIPTMFRFVVFMTAGYVLLSFWPPGDGRAMGKSPNVKSHVWRPIVQEMTSKGVGAYYKHTPEGTFLAADTNHGFVVIHQKPDGDEAFVIVDRITSLSQDKINNLGQKMGIDLRVGNWDTDAFEFRKREEARSKKKTVKIALGPSTLDEVANVGKGRKGPTLIAADVPAQDLFDVSFVPKVEGYRTRADFFATGHGFSLREVFSEGQDRGSLSFPGASFSYRTDYTGKRERGMMDLDSGRRMIHVRSWDPRSEKLILIQLDPATGKILERRKALLPEDDGGPIDIAKGQIQTKKRGIDGLLDQAIRFALNPE